MNVYTPAAWYWIIGNDETQAYSSADMTFVPMAQVDLQCITHIGSMGELVEVLRSAGIPPFHTVKSYRIVRRLEEAGLAGAALQIIDEPQNAVLKARFYTLGEIPADDADARALIAAAGADPAIILAPE